MSTYVAKKRNSQYLCWGMIREESEGSTPKFQKEEDFPICSIRLYVNSIRSMPMANTHVEHRKQKEKEIDFQHWKKSFMLPWCCRHYLGAISSYQTTILFSILSSFLVWKWKEALVYGQHFVPHNVHLSGSRHHCTTPK